MDNLTLEHLSAYLPYELKMIFEGTGGRIITLMGINNQGKYGVNITGGEGAMFLNTCRFKPLLRPLSQLTQEIVHNGETFVPWVEINKFLNNGEYQPHFNVIEYNEWDSLTISFGDHCAGYSINLEALPVIQKLHEWHFDLYNLLDRGLAVAIESEGNNERNKI